MTLMQIWVAPSSSTTRSTRKSRGNFLGKYVSLLGSGVLTRGGDCLQRLESRLLPHLVGSSLCFFNIIEGLADICPNISQML